MSSYKEVNKEKQRKAAENNREFHRLQQLELQRLEEERKEAEKVREKNWSMLDTDLKETFVCWSCLVFPKFILSDYRCICNWLLFPSWFDLSFIFISQNKRLQELSDGQALPVKKVGLVEVSLVFFSCFMDLVLCFCLLLWRLCCLRNEVFFFGWKNKEEMQAWVVVPESNSTVPARAIPNHSHNQLYILFFVWHECSVCTIDEGTIVLATWIIQKKNICFCLNHSSLHWPGLSIFSLTKSVLPFVSEFLDPSTPPNWTKILIFHEPWLACNGSFSKNGVLLVIP